MRRWLGIAAGLCVLAVALSLLANTPSAANTSVEYGWLRVEEFGAISAGEEGAATMSATSDGYVRGHIYAVHLDWAPSVTDTTDIILSGTAPALTVLSKANSATDGWYYPVVAQNKSTDGSAAGTYGKVPINSRITAAVAQSSLVTTTNLVTVTVLWGD